MKRSFKFILMLCLLLASLVSGPAQAEDASQQTDTPQTKAEALLKDLTPEERVGQLFLVTFKGVDVSDTTQIYDLIASHHIGGVSLQANNDNFTGSGTTPADAYRLISQLQTDEYVSTQPGTSDQAGNVVTAAYIPLFIAISQEGDGYPNDQILSGLTPLPSPMAIGATWKPGLATQVGTVMGSELQTLGINLLFGPSLDVLEQRQSQSGNDLGTRTFGGDPFWVGEMGRAFVSGVHTGSSGRIAVIAKHFPGRGGSDRPPEDEVATVRKSLEQLKQIELAPFIAVTGNAPSTDSTSDGLLVSHIRYQGFQGNIRDTTKPVSLDPAALSQLMGLDSPGFSTWRDQGGLLVSDDLGSRAVRRFFDPSEKTFDSRSVARSALLAGNDLLYVDNFVASGDPDTYTTIVHTLDFFAQKYREDPAFAQRVDASVLRILTLKYKLYSTFTYRSVVPPEYGLNLINKTSQVTFDVARQAVTLISPSQAELDSILPKPPEAREYMVFFTDVQTGKQCSHCQETPVLGVNSLQNAVLRLYGPQVGGPVLTDRVSSYSFADLQGFLDVKKDVPRALIEEDLTQAAWVIFLIQDVGASRPDSLALRHLLSQRPDMLRNKHVIVFAFNAPYYLDATDISKLTAYYALYSKAPAFVDMAARVLFQELSPSGALPVSVPGVGYDLIVATSPDPAQTISLSLDIPGQSLPIEKDKQATVTPAPTAVPRYKIGDTIPLRTGVIYDHNHNPVPDKTVVQFTFNFGGDNASIEQVEGVTSQGVARLAYRVEKSGTLEIHVSSDPAVTSDIIRLNIPGGDKPTGTQPLPTATTTVTPSATVTITLTPTTTPTQIPLRSGYPNVGEWALVMVMIAAGSGLAFSLGYWWWGSLRWSLRWASFTVMGGLLGYLYVAIGLPGSKSWVQQSSTMGVLEITLAGMGASWLVAFIWWIVVTQLLGRNLQKSR